MSGARLDPMAWVSDAIAAVVRERFTLLLNQRQSELGAEAHISAVARRISCGEPGAVVLDGKYLLTVEAHAEELEIQRRSKGHGTGEGGLHAAG
jgi:hypothetical protein